MEYNKCNNCQGYLFAPYNSNSTAPVKMCQCPKEQSLAWECPRCHKINAPWKSNCDCLPFNPMSTQPSCLDWKIFDIKNYKKTEKYEAGPVKFNHYYIPEIGTISIEQPDLLFSDPPGPRLSSHNLNKKK